MRLLILIITLAGLLYGCGQQSETESTNPENRPVAISPSERVALNHVRSSDPEVGKMLFIEKGCVICHSVNGVGGKAAPALDAPIGNPAIDPLEFAARMWRGAPAMIELQSVELGYTIYLSTDEIANLAAFAVNREVQANLIESDLPDTIRDGLLNERFWEVEDWDEFMRDGQGDDFSIEPLSDEDTVSDENE